MENKNVTAIKIYILSLNIEDKVKKEILNEFIEFINSLKSFYGKILQNDPETAERYITINCDKFKNNLDIYLFSREKPQKYISFIKNNLSKENESKIRSDRLEEVYNLIKRGTLKNIFYKEILTYSSKNYDTLCVDIRNLATLLGYEDQIDDNENYTDLDIQSSLSSEITISKS